MKDNAEWFPKVDRYIQRHIHQPLDRETLAQIAGISVSQLHRGVVQQTGQSPSDYVRTCRLKRAGQKLRIGAVDIGAVALAAGYGSHNAFSKAFKKQFGLSPSQFRQLSCANATQLLARGKER